MRIYREQIFTFLVALMLCGFVLCGAVAAQDINPTAGTTPTSGGVQMDGQAGSHDPSTKEKKAADDLTFGESLRFCDRAETDADKGKWQDAAGEYRLALSYWSHNPLAYYGLARCAEAAGDIEGAISDYRPAIYKNIPPPGRTRILESNPDRLLEYVLLLTEARRVEEAISVYDHAVGLLNHEDGKEHALAVDLPEFGSGPGQWVYTPLEFEAMAHLALGVASNDRAVCSSNYRDAAKIDPDSAAAQYYLGKSLLGRDDKAAKAALQKAVHLGDDRTAQAAQVYLKVLD